MPSLPEAIWKRRLNSELQAMKESGEQFDVNDDLTRYQVHFTGKGLEKTKLGFKDRFNHTFEVALFRDFPYAGGIGVRWLTPIFHPNILYPEGIVCIHLLNVWSADVSVVNLVHSIKHLLEHPNPADPLNKEAAKFFKEKGMQAEEKKGPRMR